MKISYTTNLLLLSQKFPNSSSVSEDQPITNCFTIQPGNFLNLSAKELLPAVITICYVISLCGLCRQTSCQDLNFSYLIPNFSHDMVL